MTGDQLRKRRERLGLTQAQLGIALKRPANTIARWERGEVTIPQGGVLRFILDHLDRDMTRFGPDRAGFLAYLTTLIPED